MKAVKRITIPEPCHQPWQQMTPVAGGRHCESCCKSVVDFAGMNDDEIIMYFATGNNVCGRFTDDQLPRLNQSLQSRKRRIIWRYLSVAAFIAGLFSTIKVDAQVRKSTQTRKGKHFSVQIDTTSHYLRIDSIFSKVLTADKINIDKTIKPIEAKDFVVNVDHPLVGHLLGGVQVSVIAVDDWRYSYLPWRTIFKH